MCVGRKIFAVALTLLLIACPAVVVVGQSASPFAMRASGSVTERSAETFGFRHGGSRPEFLPYSQDGDSQDGDSREGEPEPYEPEEFPRALRDLRRFEIVSLGSVPLTLLFSSLGYRLYRVSSEEDVTWRDSRNFSLEQRGRVLTIGLSASLAVGVLDFILGRVE